MKKFSILFLILCISSLLQGQSYVDIDFSNDINCGYSDGNLINSKSSNWYLNIDKLTRSSGFAIVNKDKVLEIKGLKGDLSLVSRGICGVCNKPYLISFDSRSFSSNENKLEHIEYIGVLYTNEKCFYKLSKKVDDLSIEVDCTKKGDNLVFSISFKNLKVSSHYLIDNINIHQYDESVDKSVPDTTTLIYSRNNIAKTNYLREYSHQKIFSFNIEDVSYGSDELSTVVNNFKLENIYPNKVMLNKLLSNISICCNGKLLNDCESVVSGNTISFDFGEDGMEIESNSRKFIDIYADVSNSVEIASGVIFALKLSSDLFIVSNTGSQLCENQKVVSSKMVIMPQSEYKIVFSDNFSDDKSKQYLNIDNWLRFKNEDRTEYSDYCLQANSTATKRNYLSVNQDLLVFNRQDISWSIDISNGDWNPSSSNKFCFFLMADKQLLYDNVSGYAVGVDMDGHDDILCLYRVDNGVYTRIAETSYMWGEKSYVNLRVIRLHTGNWIISYNDNPSSLVYKVGIECYDNVYKDGEYSGVLFHYTSSRANKLWIDNYNISVVKDSGGVVEQFYLDKDDNLCIVFYSDVNKYDILLSANYLLSTDTKDVQIEKVSEIGNHIELNVKLITGKYCLALNNIHNSIGELLNIKDICFEYVSTANKGDVVINELMLNPLDDDFEYLELYNTKDYDIDLSGVSYSCNGVVKDIINDELIPAKSYLLLCSASGYKSVSGNGKTHAVKSFVLNNKSASICLKYINGIIIDSLKYSDSWYDSAMSSKGISLERISVIEPNNSINWTSSKADEGGTPGKENQTKGDIIIKESAQLVDVQVTNLITVRLIFDKEIDENSLENGRVFTFRPSNLLLIKNIKIGDNKDIFVSFTQNLPEGEQCSVEVHSLMDCDGLKINSSKGFVIPYLIKEGDLIINEVLFRPFSGGVSFIEIYNNSNHLIDLSNVYISFSMGKYLQFSSQSIKLKSESYVVLSNDKSGIINFYDSVNESKLIENKAFPSMIESNSICISNKDGFVVDKLLLDDSVFDGSSKDGVSLQRKSFLRNTNDKDNWAYDSVADATPTRENSLLDNKDLVEINVTNQTFKPLSGGEDNKYLVDIINKGDVIRVSMYIYNIHIRKKIKTIANNLEVVDKVVLSWDGRDEDNKLVPTTSYMVVIEIIHTDGSKEIKKFACVPCL